MIVILHNVLYTLLYVIVYFADVFQIYIGDFFGVKIERLLLGNNSIHELNFLSFWGLEYSLETLDLLVILGPRVQP